MSQANSHPDRLKEGDGAYVPAEARGGQGEGEGAGGQKATCKKGPRPASDHLPHLLISALVSFF